MYNAVVAASAKNTARGTVRDGFRTSPLGASATSTPAYAKISSRTLRPIASTGGSARPGDRRRIHEERAHAGEDEERRQLGDRNPFDEARSDADAAHIQPRERGQEHGKHADVRRPRRDAGDEDRELVEQGARDARDREQAREPLQHAGEEPDEWPEGRFDVGVDAAGHRHAASRHRQADGDARHDGRAQQEGDRRSRAESLRDERGDDENSGADCRVDDGRCQLADAERPHEGCFAGGKGSQ